MLLYASPPLDEYRSIPQLGRATEGSGLAPADIGKIIGASRATVYRYLSIGANEAL
jgi:hypothetical protein